MAQYQDSSGRIGKGEMLKGWYHSYVLRAGDLVEADIPDILDTDAGYPVSTSTRNRTTRNSVTPTLPSL